MRRATLLLLIAAVFLGVSSSAMAQGGSAVCSGSTQVARAQTVGGLALEAGPYEITVRETGDLTCDQAREAFREILAEPGENLPDGWQVDLTARSFAREDGSDAFTINPVVPPIAADGGGLSWDDIESWMVVWLPIIFMALIALFLLMTLRYMPRTKPQQIKPASAGAVKGGDAAGGAGAEDAARKEAPAIVFIDELDAVGATRGKDISGEKDQTLNQLLVELDGFDEGAEIVVIAASNLLEKLDPALLRPGRFDRQVLVSAPDVAGREAVLKVHTRNKPVAAVDLEKIARQTSGLTGADLANIANEAAIRAARDRRDTLVQED